MRSDENSTDLEENLARELNIHADVNNPNINIPLRGEKTASELADPLEALRKLKNALQPARAKGDAPEVPGFAYRGELGRGGMGIVMRAYDAALEREVAIKFLAFELSVNSEARERFLKEARALAKLRHPNLVAVHSAGEVDGRPYFAMELVQGTSLDRAIQRAKKGDGGAIPTDPAARSKILARVFSEITDALASVHRSGLLHRDIKPANLLIATDGTARLADFGISADRRNDHDGGDSGTLRYLPPERITAGVTEDGPRADVYALGLTMIESLTLTPAFSQKNTPELRAAILAGISTLPPHTTKGIDARLLAIPLKAASRNAADRYADAAEMLFAIRELDKSPGFPIPKTFFLAGAAFLLISAGVGIAAMMGAFQRPPLREPREGPARDNFGRDNFSGGPNRNIPNRPRNPVPNDPDRLNVIMPAINRMIQFSQEKNWDAFLRERDHFIDNIDDDSPPCRVVKAWVLALQESPDPDRARGVAMDIGQHPLPQPVEKFRIQLLDFLDGKPLPPLPNGPPRRNR
ncbi:MAG: serine/threonine-protein kinase [Planctomycetota bacterium]